MNICTDKQLVLEMAKKGHWQVREVATLPMLATAIVVGNWEFLPIEQDDTIIPKRAKQRIKAIQKLNIPMQGIVIGHDTTKPKRIEAPKLELLALNAPAIKKPAPPEEAPREQPQVVKAPKKKRELPDLHLGTVGEVLMGALWVVGMIFVWALQIVWFLVQGVLFVIGGILAIAVDPAIIVVLEDGTWIEVARWES